MCVHLLVSHLVKDPPLLTRRFVVFCLLIFTSISRPHPERKVSELDRHCSFDLQVDRG